MVRSVLSVLRTMRNPQKMGQHADLAAVTDSGGISRLDPGFPKVSSLTSPPID